MILKILKDDSENFNHWIWYYGIEATEIYLDKDTSSVCVRMTFRETKETVDVTISGPTYLCNDRGQTIERLWPMKEKKTISK